VLCDRCGRIAQSRVTCFSQVLKCSKRHLNHPVACFSSSSSIKLMITCSFTDIPKVRTCFTRNTVQKNDQHRTKQTHALTTRALVFFLRHHNHLRPGTTKSKYASALKTKYNVKFECDNFGFAKTCGRCMCSRGQNHADCLLMRALLQGQSY
jgi:hypothetical protein